ncbi:MAG: flagellin, partial [Pseudomonadota bacterium]
IPSGDLAGTTFELNTSNFNVQVEDLTVSSPPEGSAVPVMEVVIGGEIYRSQADLTTTIAGSTATNPSTITLENVNDPFKTLTFTNGTTALELDTAGKALAAQDALKAAFGISGEVGGSDISFQVGSSIDNTIRVQLKGANTRDLFLNDFGTYTNLDISTLKGANNAGSVISNAIEGVTARVSNVGALQSRFDFASSSIESGIANLDSARSVFLDTDLASESTALATAQVRYQASISVLVQANQLSSSLVKLIG